MPNILVTYDLPSRNYEAVESVIDALGTWAKVGTTTFVINTNLSAEAVRDRIRPSLGANDKLFVCDTGMYWAATNQPQDVIAWLRRYWG